MSRVINSILNLKDNFSSTLKKVAGNTKNFNSQLRSADVMANKMTRSFSKFAKVSAAIGIAGVGIAVKKSIDTFKDFEQAMAQTAGTAGINQSSEAYVRMEKAARNAGKATTKTAKESADALGYMALAGWSVDDSIKGLMPILRMSEATQADLASTSDLVTDSMSALGVSVDELGHYLDVATVANNKSNQTAQMLMEAYIGVGGTFTRLGTPLNESAALLGVMANRGIKAGEAGNSLNSILINLTKKSGESAEAMNALNINAYDSQGKFRGVTNVLKELNDKTKKLTGEQRDLYLQMIGGKTQITTLNSLMSGLNTTNAEGVNELDALNKQLQKTDGALNNMANTVNNTLSGAFARMGSAIDDAKIEIGSKVAPLLTPLINGLSEKLPNATEKFGKSIDKASTIVKNFLKLASGKFYWKEGQELKNEIAQLTGISITSIDKISKKIRQFQDKLKDCFSILRTVKTLLTGKLSFYDLDNARNELSKLTGFDTDKITEVVFKIRQNFLNLDTIVPIIKGVVAALGSFMVITKVTKFASNLIKTGGKLKGVLKLLNLTMLANPFVLAALAIGVLVTAFLIAYKKSEEFRNCVNRLWEKFKEFGSGLGTQVITKLKDLAQWFSDNMIPKIQKLIAALKELWDKVLLPLALWLQPVFAALFDNAFIFISASIRNAIEIAKSVLSGLTTALTGVIEFLTGVFTGDWEKAWNGVKDIFGGVFEAIGGVFKGTINSIINGMNNFTGKLNAVTGAFKNVKGLSWVADIKIPQIPHFALGTQYFSGGIAQINERGGEIVNLPNGSKVIPADKSKKIINNNSRPIIVNINVSGNMYGNDEAAEQIGDIMVKKIMAKCVNM